MVVSLGLQFGVFSRKKTDDTVYSKLYASYKSTNSTMAALVLLFGTEEEFKPKSTLL